MGLGVAVDLSNAHTSHVVLFAPKPGRIANILSMFEQSFHEGRMTPAIAGSLVGKLGFVCRTTYGRVGRAALLPLIHRQTRDTEYSITDAIRGSYDFYVALFRVMPPISVPSQPNPLPPITLLTDASFAMRKDRKRKRGECTERKLRFDAELGFVFHDPLDGPGVFKYGAAVPKRAVLDTFSPNKKTYIAQLEALAAVSAYFHTPLVVSRPTCQPLD